VVSLLSLASVRCATEGKPLGRSSFVVHRRHPNGLGGTQAFQRLERQTHTKVKVKLHAQHLA